MCACVDVMPGIGAKNTFRRSNFAFDRSGNRRQGKSVSEIGGPFLLCYNMQKYFLRTSFCCTIGEETKSSRISLSLCTAAGHSCPCFSESSRSQFMHTPIPVGATLSVKVKEPEQTHEVKVDAVKAWLGSQGRSPRDLVERQKLREMLEGSQV
jgi:hypothetical protein